jgi:hypothetical protein
MRRLSQVLLALLLLGTACGLTEPSAKLGNAPIGIDASTATPQSAEKWNRLWSGTYDQTGHSPTFQITSPEEIRLRYTLTGQVGPFAVDLVRMCPDVQGGQTSESYDPLVSDNHAQPMSDTTYDIPYVDTCSVYPGDPQQDIPPTFRLDVTFRGTGNWAVSLEQQP